MGDALSSCGSWVWVLTLGLSGKAWCLLFTCRYLFPYLQCFLHHYNYPLCGTMWWDLCQIVPTFTIACKCPLPLHNKNCLLWCDLYSVFRQKSQHISIDLKKILKNINLDKYLQIWLFTNPILHHPSLIVYHFNPLLTYHFNYYASVDIFMFSFKFVTSLFNKCIYFI